MSIRAPFEPRRGTNQVVTPAAASASTTIDPVAKSVRFVNSGAAICHVRIGPTKAVAEPATTADMPILAGGSIVVQKGDGDNLVAYISAAGTTLHIQTGEGGI
jgi:hypothetical protein